MGTALERNLRSKSKDTPYYIDGDNLNTEDVFRLVSTGIEIAISNETKSKIMQSRALLDKFILENRVIYGVNTSLGGFVNWLIPGEHAQELQDNLISAVATNVGQYLEDHYVKASMLARLNSLARGVVVHEHKRHRGQLITAKNLWSLLSDSKMIVDEDIIEDQLKKLSKSIPVEPNSPIEDAYSIRCTPHILGPIKDCLI